VSPCQRAGALLENLFRTAVNAAHPATVLPRHLPAPPPSGRLLILAAGKAAGSMTEVAERHYVERGLPDTDIEGLRASCA
jgi:glycerate 2-kinase